MKTLNLLIASVFLTLTSVGQVEKNVASTFQFKYHNLAPVPVLDKGGATKYSLEFVYPEGKLSKFKKEIAAVEISNAKKADKGAVSFKVTIKDPVAAITQKDAADGTYFYEYVYTTPLFVETTNNGKLVDTVTFFFEGRKIKTISAAPIALVDNFVKTPIFKGKVKSAKKKSVKAALGYLSSRLSDRFAYTERSIMFTYHQIAQNGEEKFETANKMYNDFKAGVAAYKANPIEARKQLKSLLLTIDTELVAKKADGKSKYMFIYACDLEVTKLAILMLAYDFEKANAQLAHITSEYSNQNSMFRKLLIEYLPKWEANFKSAKEKVGDFEY